MVQKNAPSFTGCCAFKPLGVQVMYTSEAIANPVWLFMLLARARAAMQAYPQPRPRAILCSAPPPSPCGPIKPNGALVQGGQECTSSVATPYVCSVRVV